MDAVYDDNLHVLRACEMLQTRPTYRPLVYWLTCQMGESVELTGWMSLVFLVGTAILLLRLTNPGLEFKRPFQPSFHKFSDPRHWLVLSLFFHPIFLFPYFYPSQISNSMTMLWATFSLWLLEQKLAIWVVALVAVFQIVIGNLIRVESIFYFIMLVGAVYVFRGPVQGRWNPLRVFEKAFCVKVASFVGGFQVITRLMTTRFLPSLTWVGNETGTANVVRMVGENGEPNFPAASHWPVQVYAQFLYLKNLLYPLGFSFFGPWNHWWKVYTGSNLKWGLYLAGITLVSALLGLSLRARPASSVRTLSLGLLVYISVTALCSAALRPDWYFVSREVFGVALLVPFVALAVQKMRSPQKRKIVSSVMAVYLFGSFAIIAFVKYHNFDSFLADEERKVGESSPYVNYERMKRYSDRGDYALALRSAYQTYRTVPPDSVKVSRSAQSYWESSLAKSYELAEQLGDHVTAMKAVKVLMHSESYLSTWACLVSDYLPATKCLEGVRKTVFCANRQKAQSEMMLCSPEKSEAMAAYCEPELGKKLH